MENQERTTIVDVKIVDNFIEASKNAAYWKQELKLAQEQGKEYKGDINKVVRELAKANNEFRESKKVLESTAQAEEVLNKTSDNTIQTLGQMQRELSALRSVPFELLSEEEVNDIKKRMADLMASIADAKAEIKGLDTGAVWANAAAGLQTVVSGVQLLGQSLNALGVESEWAERLQSSIVQLIGATQALGTVVEYLEKRKAKLLVTNIKTIAANIANAASLKTQTIRTNAQTAAEAAMNTIRGKGNIITKAAAVVTWAWNAALAANPVVLLVVGVAALVAGIAALFKAFDKSADASKNAAKAQKEYEEQSRATDMALKELSLNQTKEANQLSLENKARITELKKRGATAEEIARVEFENAKKVRDMEVKYADARIAKNEEIVAAVEKHIAAQEALLGKLREGSKKYEEQKKKIEELRGTYLDLLGTIESDVNAKKNAAQEQADAEIEYQKQVADATYDRLLKTLEQQKAIGESRIKAEAGYLSSDFAMKQQYAKRVQDLNTQSELQRITLSRKYNKITEAEYRAQLAVLNNAMQEFSNKQAQEANEYYIAQRKAILSMFDQTAQEQIDEVNRKFEKALQQLKQQTEQAPDASAYEGGTSNAEYQKAQKEYEDFLFRMAEIELRLERQKQQEIADIQKNSLRKRAEEIEKQINEQYEDDLKRYQSNERKKTEITIEQLQVQKAAKERAGLNTYDEDAQLLESRRRLNQMDLDSQLLAAGENAKAIYEAKKRYIDEERKLADGNLDRQAELNAEALQNEQEYTKSRIEAVEQWANAAMDAMSSVNDLFAALDERRLQEVQEKYDRESEMLQEQLDRGLISQEVYEKKQKALDQDLEKEQKKIAREQAKREKAMAIFQVIVDTSLGIMKALANMPPPVSYAMAAVTGALGAVQLATVIAQPLPKAARGRKIKGKSHAQGGELVVAEDGEIIMNKRSVSMFEPLLSEISVAGGGVPFSSHIPDGGYTARWMQSNSTDVDDLRDAMSAAVKDLKIYTAITDIRREDGQYTTVEARGSI